MVAVTVPLPETVLGDAEQVTFVSVDATEQENVMASLNPFSACTEMFTAPELPRFSARVAAEALSAKSAAGGGGAVEAHSETRL